MSQRIVVTGTETVSDKIVNFQTNIEYPFSDVSVAFSPVQDLHGYDNPWPAGGGKNLFNYNLATFNTTSPYGLQITRTGDLVNVSGTSTNSSKTNLQFAVTTTYANGDLSGKGYVCQAMDVTGTHTINSAWGFRTASEKAFAISVANVEPSASVNVTFRVSVAASSQTTWTPFENICPISGWSECNVWDDPKYGGTIEWNQQFLAASEWKAHSVQSSVSVSDGVITATLISGTPTVYSPAIDITGGTTVNTIANHKYYCACKFNPAADGFPYLRNNTAFGTPAVFGAKTTTAGEWGSYENIVSATATGGPAWYLGNGGNTSQIQVGDSFSIKDLMCIDITEMFGAGNEPSTVEEFKALFPNDYYPYNEGEETCVSAVSGLPYRHVTVDLNGERYGGTLNVVNGTLRVDAVLEVFNVLGTGGSINSDLGLDYISPSTSVADLGDVVRVSCGLNTGVSSLYDRVSSGYEYKMCNMLRHYFAYYDNTTHWYRNGVLYLFLPKTLAGSTAQSVIDYLVSVKDTAPLSLWIPLAEPIEIQLTPTQVQTLAGGNHVWSSVNGNTTITYSDGYYIDYISKIIYGDKIILDLTSDTITEPKLLTGYTAHRADGEYIEGSLPWRTVVQETLLYLDRASISQQTLNTDGSVTGTTLIL